MSQKTFSAIQVNGAQGLSLKTNKQRIHTTTVLETQLKHKSTGFILMNYFYALSNWVKLILVEKNLRLSTQISGQQLVVELSKIEHNLL